MKFFLSLLCSVLLLSCHTSIKNNESNLPFLPNEASVIFKINDLKKTRSVLKNNSLLQHNKKNSLYQFFLTLEPFNSLKLEDFELFLAFSPIGKNDFGISLVLASDIASSIDFNSYYLTDRTYNNFLYKEYKINNKSFYGAQLNDSWVFSDNYLLIENHIKQFENSILYKYSEAFETLTNESVSLVIINSEFDDITGRLFPNLPNDFLLRKKVSGWLAGDFNITKNKLSFNAVYKPNSKEDFTKIFKNTIPKKNRLSEIVPYSFNSYSSITYDDYETFSKNLAIYKGSNITPKVNKIEDFLSEVVEFGTINLSEKRFAAFRISNETTELSSYFDFDTEKNLHREIEIYKLNSSVDFSTLLNPLINIEKVNYCIHFKEFVLFASTAEHLKKIIPHLKNKTTLFYKKWYSTFSNQLTEESSLLYITNTNFLDNNLKKTLSKSEQKKWGDTAFKKYKVGALQLVYEGNFSHLHLTASKNEEKQIDFSVNETENIILNSSILSNPQFVRNYINKTKDIVVQDEELKLNIITNNGELKWSKNIKEPILSKIHQLDMYRNGRLQYLFNTPTKLYVLDRNGKEVAPFPIEFKTPITQGVSLFDYDNNRKYRILVTQDSKLTMFDQKGKKVKGFKFKNKFNGTITHSPKHFRIGKKDFIVVNENKGGVHFLNRTGKQRITPKQTPIKTQQEWFLHKNLFTTLNEKNTITEVKPDHTVSYKSPKLKLENAVINATSKTWVSIAENSLNIKNKIIELEYGRYTSPKIYYMNNKIYVSVTNLDAKKVYLFDSNAKIIEGFPVFGTSEAVIDNSDKDAYLELIVKGDRNSILFYEFR